MFRYACRTASSRVRFVARRRSFSDKLMGYSPMSPGGVAPIGGAHARIPTAKDVTTSGGVWAPTSSKRDKLTELKLALDPEHDTLDDVATELQLQDLYLADGVQLVGKVTDQALDVVKKDSEIETAESESGQSKTEALEDPILMPKIQDFVSWLDQNIAATERLDQTQYAAYLTLVSEQVTQLRSTIPAELCLKEIRDFLDPSEMGDAKARDKKLDGQNSNFQNAVMLFRLQLVQALVEHLREESSWTTLTTVSDSDVDRAAVRGENIEELRQSRRVVPADKLHVVIRAFATGSSHDRVDALWQLFDQDDDGLLEQPEMNYAVRFAVTPVQLALNAYFDGVLEANVHSLLDPERDMDDPIPTPKGLLARRRETKAKKHLRRIFQQTTKTHFEDEVEMPHRLRCIYAWSEKEHQENKMDSVLVEAEETGWAGRKRYVELPPKISLPEFREVQKIHFTHLDRVADEVLTSYRQNLWVDQGKGRQNRELTRDCLLFLIGVSIVDYGILAL